MNRSWTGGAHTDAKTPRQLCKARCQESGRFFVTYPDKTDAVLTLSQRLDDGVNAIADDTESKGGAQATSVSISISAVFSSGEKSSAGCDLMAADPSEG